MRTDAEFRLNKELEEHQVLFTQLADAADGDEGFLADLIEGETTIFDLIEKIDLQIAEADIEADGADAQVRRMQERKKRAENRSKRLKQAIKHAMEIAKLTNHKTSISSFIIGAAPIKAIVLQEEDVPLRWWKKPDPVVDQGGLTAYFRDAKKASDAANKIKDQATREIALAQAAKDFPEIPGVSCSAGATQITRK